MPLFFRNFGGASSQARKPAAAVSVKTPIASSPALQVPSTTRPVTQATISSFDSTRSDNPQVLRTPAAVSVSTLVSSSPSSQVPIAILTVTDAPNPAFTPTRTRAKLNTNIAQVFADLHRTASTNSQLSKLSNIAHQLSDLFERSERSSDTRLMLAKLKGIVADIVSLLSLLPEIGKPSDAYSHMYRIAIALSDLQEMIEDECEETDVYLYKLSEFSEVKCSSDADAQAPKIIGRLYAGYQDADVRDSTTSADVALKPNPGLFKRVLRPERYELNDRQVYRGHGANIAVHGDIGGRNKGAVLADFGFGQIAANGGGFLAENNFEGHEGARFLAMGTVMNAPDGVFLKNIGNLAEVDVAGSKMVSQVGSIFSFSGTDEAPRPPPKH
ncbi:hypothetical protein BDV98DRAFT_597807 [Pterulicium gracile]|uniref:Uncharacterized protein n=1 Tax=Pterulicium gracile TaxID=1884261 RepID=A0A5C3QCP3_9AGAR|nr:hypothetical protein BDV98DRAFT_597807 [Pterula gracilis]